MSLRPLGLLLILVGACSSRSTDKVELEPFDEGTERYVQEALVELVDQSGGRTPGFVVDRDSSFTAIQTVAISSRPADSDGGGACSTSTQVSLLMPDGGTGPGREMGGRDHVLILPSSGVGPLPLSPRWAAWPRVARAMWRDGAVHRVQVGILGGTSHALAIDTRVPPGAVLLSERARVLGIVTAPAPNFEGSLVKPLFSVAEPRRLWQDPPSIPLPAPTEEENRALLSRHLVSVYRGPRLVAVGMDWFVTLSGEQAMVLPRIVGSACADGKCELARSARGKRVPLRGVAGHPGPAVTYSRELPSEGGLVPFDGCRSLLRFRPVLVGQEDGAVRGLVSRRHSYFAPRGELDLPPGLVPGPVLDATTGRFLGLTWYGGEGGEVPEVECLDVLFPAFDGWAQR